MLVPIPPKIRIKSQFFFFEKQAALRGWDPYTTPLSEVWNSPQYRQERLSALECRECFWNCHAELNQIVPM